MVTGSSASAKEGFFLGAQLPVNFVRGDFNGLTNPKVHQGAGFGLIAGYGFSKNLSLEIDWSGSSHTAEGAKIGFGEFSWNAKYAFITAHKMQPFFFAGAGAFALGDKSLMFGGRGFNVGFGGDYYLSEKTSLGIGFIMKFITYDKITKSEGPATLVGDINGDTASIRFDLTRHF
jgi:hypothetical protein